jgi:ADP-ribose pyrophosphatase YjhB (NUDIX family)
MIRVVCSALILEDGKAYLIQEGKEVAKGLWGLPGGKLEEGESLIECIKREVYEETGMQISQATLFKVVNKPRSREGNTVVKCIFRCMLSTDVHSSSAELHGQFFTSSEVQGLADAHQLRGDELPALVAEAVDGKAAALLLLTI